MKSLGVLMEDLPKERKCECGRMVNRLFKFCPECGAPEIMVRSENEIKTVRAELENMLSDIIGSPGKPKQGQVIATTPVNLPVIALIMQTLDFIEWTLGRGESPIENIRALRDKIKSIQGGGHIPGCDGKHD